MLRNMSVGDISHILMFPYVAEADTLLLTTIDPEVQMRVDKSGIKSESCAINTHTVRKGTIDSFA